MRVTFVHITDHHILASEDDLARGFNTAYSFRKTLRHIADTVGGRFDFIVSTGDLVNTGEDAQYANFARMMGLERASPPPGPQRITIEGLQRCPIYFLGGNHDPRAVFYRHIFGVERDGLLNAAFLHRGVQFVCFDWGPDVKAVASPAMLAFLDAALRAPQPSVLLCHHAVTPVGAAWLDTFLADDLDAFWDIVRGRNVLGIFTGHVHMTYEQYVEGVPVFGLRSTMFQFAPTPQPTLVLDARHYRLVTIDDGVLTTRVFEVPI